MDYGAGGGYALGGGGYGGAPVEPYATAAAPPAIGGTTLPESHEEQVQLGFRMIHNSYTSKVTHLEQKLAGLKTETEEHKSQSSSFQRKNATLEGELAESHSRQQQLSEKNRELFKNVQNLRRQLQRLEGLKRKVLDSISDEPQHDAIPDYDTPYQSAPWGGAGGHSAGQSYAAEPMMPARARSPPRQQPYGGGSAEARSVSPPATGAPVDGKAFFRQARAQLSYEAFNEFLANIKRLNDQQQSRDETLSEARRIFGPELQHLYREFEALLNRHGLDG